MAGRTVTNLSEENAFGQLLEGMVKQLLLAPPYIYGYEYPLPSGDPCWVVHVNIAARQEPTPGQKIDFRVARATWECAVEEALRKALSDVAYYYRRDLVDTVYRYFPQSESSTFCAPRCTIEELDQTIAMTTILVQALENRVGNKSLQVDAMLEEKKKILQEIQQLRAQTQQAPDADIGTSRPRRLRKTARKTVIRRRAYFRTSWYDDQPFGFSPPPPHSPVKKQIESKGENSVSEEEPMEMEPEPSEHSMDDTAQSKFTLTFAKASDFPGPCPYGFCGWLDD